MYHENQQRDQEDTCCNRFIICDLVFIYIYICTYIIVYIRINISIYHLSLVYKCGTHIHSATEGFSGQTGVKRNKTL